MTTNIADTIRSSNIEVHNREAAIYDAIHPELFGLFEQRKITRDLDLIASIMPTRSPVRVLDIGCGTGNLTIKYLKRGYRVKAVDISPEMIGILRSKINPAELSYAELVVSDAEDIVASTQTYGTWDVISFSSVLHHLPDYKIVLAHAVRQLRPGGVLYICHEPLPTSGTDGRAASSFLARILNSIDTLYIYTRKLLVYVIQSIRARKCFKRIDYRWSDYHSGNGIDADKMLRELEWAGARTLLYETYRNRYSGVLTALDVWFGLSEPSHFRFIVQRIKRSTD